MNRRLNFMEIGAGIGVGTQACLITAGCSNVNIVGCIDNEYKNEGCMYAYNYFHKTNFDKSDIVTLDFSTICDNIDLVTISFPSNTFSNRNYKKPMLENFILRNYNMPMGVYKFVEFKKPKCFIIDYTLQQSKAQQIDNISDYLGSLQDLGYAIKIDEYNAKNFNTPQDRTRLCVVGFLKCLNLVDKFEFPKGVETRKTINDILLDKVDDKYYLTDKQIEKVKLAQSKDGGRLYYENGYYEDIKHTSATNIFIENNNTLMRTITANYGYHRGYSPIIKDKTGKWRLLTPLEIFRCMGLVDGYYYCLREAGFDDEELYRLAGNSMIGSYWKELMECIFKLSEFRFWEMVA